MKEISLFFFSLLQMHHGQLLSMVWNHLLSFSLVSNEDIRFLLTHVNDVFPVSKTSGRRNNIRMDEWLNSLVDRIILLLSSFLPIVEIYRWKFSIISMSNEFITVVHVLHVDWLNSHRNSQWTFSLSWPFLASSTYDLKMLPPSEKSQLDLQFFSTKEIDSLYYGHDKNIFIRKSIRWREKNGCHKRNFVLFDFESEIIWLYETEMSRTFLEIDCALDKQNR